MKKILAAATLCLVAISASAFAQVVNQPCVCPKYPAGQGTMNGQQVYFYYAISCPGSQPCMYVTANPVGAFNANCNANGDCAGSAAFPKYQAGPEAPAAKAYRTGSPLLEIELNQKDGTMGLAGLGLSQLLEHSQVRRPQLIGDAGIFGTPIYVKIDAERGVGPEILVKAIPFSIDPVTQDPELSKRLIAAYVPAGNQKIENIGFGFQFFGDLPADVIVKPMTWRGVTKIDANAEEIMVPSTETKALSFVVDGVTYLVVTKSTITR